HSKVCKYPTDMPPRTARQTTYRKTTPTEIPTPIQSHLLARYFRPSESKTPATIPNVQNPAVYRVSIPSPNTNPIAAHHRASPDLQSLTKKYVASTPHK